jgi:cell division protein FtsB
MARKSHQPSRWSQPSAWIILVAGALTVFFFVAIIREVVRTATVRRQVARLQQEVQGETVRQGELEDLIGYLSSPTFQEREARLRLGLKKNGERVIVIPSSEKSTTDTSADGTGPIADQAPSTPAQRWWQYFFGTEPGPTSSS